LGCVAKGVNGVMDPICVERLAPVLSAPSLLSCAALATAPFRERADTVLKELRHGQSEEVCDLS
jgi:hypothetical protein